MQPFGSLAPARVSLAPPGFEVSGFGVLGLAHNSIPASGEHGPMEASGTSICNMHANLQANHAHNEKTYEQKQKHTPML